MGSAGPDPRLQTPELILARLRVQERAERRRGRAADVFLYGMAVGTAILIAWTMIRLDVRSGELAEMNRARYTPCPCLPPPPP
jgi:hypothetical protein